MSFEIRVGLLVFCIVQWVPYVNGIRCYTCTSGGEPESACEKDDPKDIESRECRPGQLICSIQRQELKIGPGYVNSFFRGCETQPRMDIGAVEDDSYRTYYYYCQTDLCNTGDGKEIRGTDAPVQWNKPPPPPWPLQRTDSSSTALPSYFLIIFLCVLFRVLQFLQH